jgi:DNA-directed RNA polymerase subunit RPC12/RpoP
MTCLQTPAWREKRGVGCQYCATIGEAFGKPGEERARQPPNGEQLPGRRSARQDRARELHLTLGGMDLTAKQRTEHRCNACGRMFALVSQHPSDGTRLPIYLSCPHCGSDGFVSAPSAVRQEPDGALVIALEYRVEAIG